METLIQPRVLKGFRDYLPEAEIPRALLIEKLTAVFRASGFIPIDTPVLEYAEILLRKSGGETEKQVFRFEDNGGRDVALRFDLTVPFARFVAEHKGELYFPFKRYHIAKVWRGEKPQAGRYREFVQCDFDIVGSDSAAADFEILQLMKTSLDAIGVDTCTIKINHRGIFNRFLDRIGMREQSEEVLRAVDRLAKVGEDEVRSQLEALIQDRVSAAAKAQDILDYIRGGDSFEETLSVMERMAGGPSEGAAEDIGRMRKIRAMMEAAGIEQFFVLDPSITRGLDYYTGIVYETFLDELPELGSVCSGGRYDNLAGLYMKERVPGVGSSIGLDRLLAGLETLGGKTEIKSFLDAEIFCLDEELMPCYQKLAVELRREGIACEVFPDPRKISQQYTVAEKKGIPFGILLEKPEAEKNILTLKDLRTRETFEGITPEKAAEKIRAELPITVRPR
ncbi:MAG: histidine--tRNA ligase [Spirochaetaceae bacterium]|jgi:histidyl-tRNA synthetase|nr:histidine--tRNA ligase [Spirochaetaceae bacterium]